MERARRVSGDAIDAFKRTAFAGFCVLTKFGVRGRDRTDDLPVLGQAKDWGLPHNPCRTNCYFGFAECKRQA
jgi:hypothetical protein